MVRLIGFCLLAAVMTMLLRQMNPGMAALLCVAFGAMTLLMLLPAVGEYAAQIRDFLSELSLEAVYGQTMLKAMGIVLMTQFAAQVCRDMDAPSIACRAELCGRLMLHLTLEGARDLWETLSQAASVEAILACMMK